MEKKIKVLAIVAIILTVVFISLSYTNYQLKTQSIVDDALNQQDQNRIEE
ncbi:hypothetical protein [Jeotgalibacillus soli]|uniref:Uncharacterized protein n=1 Tax=Jeotgalibacillus soli TaxID=889306 RepID=A0A0C2VH59_9BACL|nr:hypothetical protein [Jeotgalibacillus soli]KIL43846.1 hypothetical protein KP78_36700 [Jeotgalibacillus soli]